MARLEPAANKLIVRHASNDEYDKLMRCLATTTRQRLRAELASARGRADEALSLQAEALAASKDIDATEPALLAADALGDLQLCAGHPTDAEQTFERELAVRPGSSWALRGAARAARAQGHGAAAESLTRSLDKVWSRADGRMRAAG